MEKKVYSVDGKEKKTITLNDEVFAREVSEGAIYEAIKNELANMRVGTHSTKTRSLVNSHKQKPWRQKGTGRARAGRANSPVWVGGGTAFGPLPRDYSYTIPKKVKQLAFKSILSLKAVSEGFKVVEDFSVATGKTKDLSDLLMKLVDGQKTVIILKDDDSLIKRAARNIPWLKMLSFNRLRAHDLFYCKNVIMLEGAVIGLNSFYDEKKEA
ncbi:MAG: 50S ribosomal protein L4 [Spirochaetes bacterium GWB1_48_6]|nr:MAG: 50S ribosomal protein L4 [Spirochaetes bacterium GWB1_48_6]